MIVHRRPTQAEAERQLRSLVVRTSRLRLYHQRRAAGLCAACEEPSEGLAYCEACATYEAQKRKARAA